MGAFGPKMVKLNANGEAPPPPYTYVDNPNTLLDTGDLVFIDAMGTGFSRPDRPQDGADFGGVDNDLAAFGEFIRSFLNEYNLWGSPLFVGGESYGTTRAAGLSGYLTDHDIPINGVMLLSAVIDSNAAAGEQRQLSTLPTEIMTAHFHKKQPPDLQRLSVEQMAVKAREFASGEYLEYLFDGNRATQAEREKVLTDFSRYTGMPKPYVDSLDLRVPLGPFSTELLRDQHLMTSRLDSRFAGYQIDGGAANTSFDFSNANIENCFLTAFEAYIRNDLDYKNNDLYYVAGNAPPWSGEYNTVTNLETAFSKNPHMKLFVGMGYYDFACPFFPVEWTINHLKASDAIKKNNISFGYYESGHMVYIDQAAASKYHADLAKFVKGAVPQ
jgi:carboxypeptidase C (cathepsin A)